MDSPCCLPYIRRWLCSCGRSPIANDKCKVLAMEATHTPFGNTRGQLREGICLGLFLASSLSCFLSSFLLAFQQIMSVHKNSRKDNSVIRDGGLGSVSSGLWLLMVHSRLFLLSREWAEGIPDGIIIISNSGISIMISIWIVLLNVVHTVFIITLWDQIPPAPSILHVCVSGGGLVWGQAWVRVVSLMPYNQLDQRFPCF